MAFLYRSTCFQFSEDLDVGEELTNKVYIRDHDCVDYIETRETLLLVWVEESAHLYTLCRVPPRMG